MEGQTDRQKNRKSPRFPYGGRCPKKKLTFWAAVPIGDKVLYNGENFCPFVRSSPPLGHLARPGPQPARPEAQPASPDAKPASHASGFRPGWTSGLARWPRGGDGWMDGQTNRQKISLFYKTLLPAMKPKKKIRAGQGNR